MCGIFGYIGTQNAPTKVLSGLKRLEYRGYDSWGVAFQSSNHLDIKKYVGHIENANLSKDDQSLIAIGHTRWATHGGVTDINAHPHLSTDGSFALAQNGIVENYQEIKVDLKSKGFNFISQTDTEVIVRLIEEKLKTTSDLLVATRLAFLDLKGRNTIILIENNTNRIIAIRNGSPLVAGVSEDGFYLASDTLSFAENTDRVIFIQDFEMVEIVDGKIKLLNAKTGKIIQHKIQKINIEDSKIDKDGFDHFMIKEIVEQKHTIREAVQYSEEDLKPLTDRIKSSKRVYTVGAGTAGFAASQIAFFLREYANINAIELKSYEMTSFKNLFTKDDLIIAVSQSGETADTIEAIEFAKNKGAKVASIVNMIGSTVTRMSDYAYLSRSGPEICVASTKAFTAQISWGLLLAKTIVGEYDQTKKAIEQTGKTLEKYFTNELFDDIKKFVKVLSPKEHFFVLGKGQNYYISLEGSLKIKEITYKHFEGFPAGELKHGVIALIEKGTPVFVIISNDENKADMMSAAAEVKSRGAFVVGICKEENELFDYSIETPDLGITDPIVNVVPFQLISYFLAIELGNSPDKPRNLAKSVTVK